MLLFPLFSAYTCFIQGFHLTSDTSCQLAWCMVKLGRKPAAEELFATVRELQVIPLQTVLHTITANK